MSRTSPSPGERESRVPATGGYVYQEDGIPSPDGHCRAFDAEARGTVIGSGVALVVLKRLSDAMRDGDTVYAIIRGSAVNNDGSAKIGYTAPSIEGQVKVIEEALAVAGVSADTIGMVEAHGTGTSLGDPIEVAALTQAYRRHTSRRQYCAIGSLKTNIGHLDAGAGVAGIIKAALSLHYGEIPPSLNFRTPNPQIDFGASPFFVNTALRPWPRSDRPRRAAVSAFGLGGTNAHLVLEEGPIPSGAATPPEPTPQVIVLSARTAARSSGWAAGWPITWTRIPTSTWPTWPIRCRWAARGWRIASRWWRAMCRRPSASCDSLTRCGPRAGWPPTRAWASPSCSRDRVLCSRG